VKIIRGNVRISGALVLFAALGVSTAAAAGCQVISGLTGSFELAPADDGGPPPGSDAGNTNPLSAQPPGPPSGGPSGGPISFVAAVHTVDLGDMGDTPGYDLDHVDTCYDDAGGSCVSSKTHCDANGGIDNGGAALLSLVELTSTSVNFHSTYLDTSVNEGKWTLLIQVTDYNGEDDDLGVNVAIYPSTGLGSAPQWDGTDAWPVEPSSVGPGGLGDPVYTSLGAYVSGGVLVAGLPTVSILFSGGSTFGVTLVGGVLTGKLVKGPHGWGLTNGIVAGRWTTQAVFQALSALRVNGAPFCTDSQVFALAQEAICSGADILANASDPPTLPCDSISLGFGFTADPAQIGPLGPPLELDGGCPPGMDPSTATCN
jgi:hypothetical protein